MAVDPELKALLNALVEGQVKLSESQQKLSESQQKLSESQQKLSESQQKLSESQQKGFREVRGEIAGLRKQVKTHTDAMTRGFTESAGRHAELELRVNKLEARLDQLEHERQT